MEKKPSILPLLISYFFITLLIASNVFAWMKIFDFKDQIEKNQNEIAALKDNKSSNNNNSQSGNENNQISIEDADFTKIKPSDIKSLSASGPIVVLIGRDDCGWCQRYAPILYNASKKYNFDVKYIDLYTILNTSWEMTDQDEYDNLMNLPADPAYSTFMQENFGSTPLTLIVNNNKIIHAFAGYVEEATLNTTLEKNGFKS